MLEHVASSVTNMTVSKEKISEKILNHALEIIYLLTGEKYVLVKKRSPHCCIHPQSGTVPVKCDDVAVYFSMEEWDYVKGHKQQYQSVITETEPGSDKMDSMDSGVTEDVQESSSPELSDLHVEEIEYESTSGKEDDDDYEEEDQEKSKHETSSESPGTSAAGPFRSGVDGSYPRPPVLDESEIKVEMTEEIKEDGTYESLANKTSSPDTVGTPHYRWHPNIWSISERFICSSSSRPYDLYPPIKPATEEKPPDPARLQFLNQIALEEKPFRCIACGQMFKHKSSAVRHYSVVHGVKPHQCNDCGRRFSTKFKAVVHKCNPRKHAKDFWDDQGGV